MACHDDIIPILQPCFVVNMTDGQITIRNEVDSPRLTPFSSRLERLLARPTEERRRVLKPKHQFLIEEKSFEKHMQLPAIRLYYKRAAWHCFYKGFSEFHYKTEKMNHAARSFMVYAKFGTVGDKWDYRTHRRNMAYLDESAEDVEKVGFISV